MQSYLDRFFVVNPIFHLLMFAVLIFDIPVARQLIGFLYLTLIPGFLLLRILRLRSSGVAETILLSVGLSTSLLMFLGLLINSLYPSIGISDPLSVPPLIVSLGAFTFALSIIDYVRRDSRFSSIHKSKVQRTQFRRSTGPTFFLICVIPLAIVGAILVNYTLNSSILMLAILAVAVTVVIITLSKGSIAYVYQLAVVAIAIALLFHVSLISWNLYGYDIHGEYYVYSLTKSASHWNPVINSTYSEISNSNAMLSLTILPTIYSSIMNMDGVWIFKLVYPLIFSLVPLGLYLIYRKQIGERIAFLSTFFFMSFFTFYTEMLGLAKQMVAEVFLVLLIFLILDENMDSLKKRVLFIIFSFGLVVSHYSTAYIFMFYVLIVWLFSLFAKHKTKMLDGTYVLLFSSIAFLWFTYVSSSILSATAEWGPKLLASLSDIFNPLARDPNVAIGLGIGGTGSIGHLVGRIANLVTELFIFVGIAKLVIKRRESQMDRPFMLMSTISLVLVLINIIIPQLSNVLNISRIYQLALFFLAPACIIGAQTALNIVSRILEKLLRIKTKLQCFKRVYIKGVLLLPILLGYFLFNVGFVYEITRDVPFSVPLSMYRMDIRELGNIYTWDQDVFSARWLSEKSGYSPNLYADYIARRHVLTSYGLIPRENVYILLNTTKSIDAGCYIYLRYTNVVGGKIVFAVAGRVLDYQWNITEISSLLSNQNKIYTNGGSEVYLGP